MLPLRMLVLLMLLLLHDADSSCPSESNPLILDPVIGEYGSNAKVNCYSTNWDHEGITLSVGNHNVSSEDGKNCSTDVQLKDWNMKAECKIKLNNSTECIKEVEITAYKNPEVVLSVKNIDETQRKLQCDVTDFAPAQSLNVTWYRYDEILATNYSAERTREAVNESFTLVVHVNRSEKVAQFRCQAQLDLNTHPPLDPVISETRNVSAFYAPELSANHSDYLSISKGENVTLTCEVEGNPPPVFQWEVDGISLPENTAQLTVTQVNDSATYVCIATNDWGNKSVEFYVDVIMTASSVNASTQQAANDWGNKSAEFYVNVTEVTTTAAAVATSTVNTLTQGCPITLTPPEIFVRYGGPAEVNCTSNTAINGIGWEASVGGRSLEISTSITWKVENLKEWNIKPVCFVNLLDSSQCEVGPSVTLYQPPDFVSISAVAQGPMVEGKEYQLKCDIHNVASVQLKVNWYNGSQIVFTDVKRETDTIPTSVSTYYTVTPGSGDHGSVFRCEAELMLGPNAPEILPVISNNFTAVVHYKPFFKGFPTHYTAVENFSVSDLPFQINGNPEPHVNWYHRGTPVNPHELLGKADSGMYTAEADNDYGTTNVSVTISIEYGPSLTCKEQYEVAVNSEFENPCEVDGLPQPSITWLKHEKEFSSPSWTKHDSGTYSLQATNKHGTAASRLNLHVLYAPEFEDENTTIEITLGQNVTFNCSAKGYPGPVISWTYSESANLDVTTGERYSIITITKATSANAGDYQCAANNKVGTVTRVVTLKEKGKATAYPPQRWILPLIISAVLLVLIILLVLFINYKKKHRRYSFVRNADIPMITTSA